MQPRRLSILGVGLLGGSIGLAVRSVSSSCKIIGYGHRQETLDRALQMGAVDETTTDAAAAVAEADMVLLCTPVGLFDEMLSRVAPGLKPGVIVTDVGSTKRSIVKLADQRLPRGVHFVGSHPMAGSEKRGVEFARADLFKGATCIVTPTGATDSGALEQVEGFWQSVGMRLLRLSPEEHDRLAAQVSHVPHAVAAALVAMQSDAGLRLAGRGFLDATRIASGDGGLWRDILLDNQDHVRDGVRQLVAELDRLLQRLEQKDGDAIKQWLDAAAGLRERWVRQKLEELNPD